MMGKFFKFSKNNKKIFRCRDGKLRLLSFKIGLVIMCNATLESKYKCKFYLMLIIKFMIV